jgi:PKD repeat protein
VLANAGNDVEVCDDHVLLSANLPLAGTGSWTVVGGQGIFANVSSNVTEVSELGIGANTFQWTVSSNNCIVSDEVIVTSNLMNINAGENQILMNDFTTMDACDPENPALDIGLWTVLQGAGEFVDESLCNSEVINIGAGENIFRWTVSVNGCDASDEVGITFNDWTVSAGADQLICSNSTTLDATEPEPGYFGVWEIVSGSATFENNSIHNTFVSDIGHGENLLRWGIFIIDEYSWDEILITNNSFIINAGEDQGSCNNYATMNGEWEDGDEGVWEILSGDGTFLDSSQNNTDVTNLAQGENHFSWTVTRNNCSNTDTVVVTWNQPPIAQFDANPYEGCNPLAVDFINSSIDNSVGSTGLNFTWDFGDGHISIEENPSHEFFNYGDDIIIYEPLLIASDQFGCEDTVEGSIVVEPGPSAAFSATPFEQNYPDATVTITNLCSEGFMAYVWDFGDGIISFEENPVDHVYQEWGVYEILLTINTVYCSDTASQIVTINEGTGINDIGETNDRLIIAPNPNNGIFSLKYFQKKVGDISVEIYNHQGQKLHFEKFENVAEELNAKFDLRNYPKGVYYIRTVTDNNKVLGRKIIIE